MRGFGEAQTRLLAGKLDRKHVRTRDLRGHSVSYIEGWHAIVEANRVFGFDGWDREVVWCQCVSEEGRREVKACTYAARVRVRVRAGDVIVCREGSGIGHGSAATLGEAHESALKEAETDAMKRAFMTFGNLFGLALYDKEQRGVRGRTRADTESVGLAWTVLSADGRVLVNCADPKIFCGRLRQTIAASTDVTSLRMLWNKNAPIVEALRNCRPDLTTKKGVHFASVLERVFEEHVGRLTDQKGAAENAAAENVALPIDKSELMIATPRRIRDEEHLQFVATLPCLVCGRAPSQAHHIRFAQPRALGRKVSDEWAVPLCNMHHRALHDAGNEAAWWSEQGIDARAEAERLWREHRSPADTTTAPSSATAGAGASTPDSGSALEVRLPSAVSG